MGKTFQTDLLLQRLVISTNTLFLLMFSVIICVDEISDFIVPSYLTTDKIVMKKP